mmetsp:Transcript_27690/g.52704  ORF Transcript_27690/g.52704 Transcript_27690/m.52704 type:complete len:407 (+) Transcript_27690:344-1564(+)
MKLPVDGHQRQVGALVPALPEVDGERGLSRARHPEQEDVRLGPALGHGPVVVLASELHRLNHAEVLRGERLGLLASPERDAAACHLQVLLHVVQQPAPQVHRRHLCDFGGDTHGAHHAVGHERGHHQGVLLRRLLEDVVHLPLLVHKAENHEVGRAGLVDALLKLPQRAAHRVRRALACAVRDHEDGLGEVAVGVWGGSELHFWELLQARLRRRLRGNVLHLGGALLLHGSHPAPVPGAARAKQVLEPGPLLGGDGRGRGRGGGGGGGGVLEAPGSHLLALLAHRHRPRHRLVRRRLRRHLLLQPLAVRRRALRLLRRRRQLGLGLLLLGQGFGEPFLQGLVVAAADERGLVRVVAQRLQAWPIHHVGDHLLSTVGSCARRWNVRKGSQSAMLTSCVSVGAAGVDI